MNIKINILRIILIVLLLSNLWIIFGFSNQNGEQSGSLSREITETITKNIKSIQKLDEPQKEKILSKIEHIIRKLAHFSLYTSLGFLTMSLITTYKLTEKQRIIFSLCIGWTYAITDEIHQIFIPDRTPKIGDVLIDTSGVIFGIIIVIIGIKIYKKMHNETAKNCTTN